MMIPAETAIEKIVKIQLKDIPLTVASKSLSGMRTSRIPATVFCELMIGAIAHLYLTPSSVLDVRVTTCSSKQLL